MINVTMLNIILLNVISYRAAMASVVNAKCYSAECHYAGCRGVMKRAHQAELTHLGFLSKLDKKMTIEEKS